MASGILVQMSPVRHKTIIWTNADLLSIGPSWIFFSEITIKLLIFSLKEMYFKSSWAERRPFCSGIDVLDHYCDVIMGATASQITSLTILSSTVYSGADRRKHQTPRHWPLCGEFTGDWWIPRTNGQWRGKCFHSMTSSCAWTIRMGTISVMKTYNIIIPSISNVPPAVLWHAH